MGVGFHFRHPAVKIVDHVVNEIENDIFTKIIEQNRTICVMITKTNSISNKLVFMIFLNIEDYNRLPTIFLDLAELDGQRAEEIDRQLLKSLHDVEFNDEYLRKNSMAFC